MTPTIILDFDNTIISAETLDVLAHITLINHPKKVEIEKEIVKITEQAMSGELPFGDALSARLKMLPLHSGVIKEVSTFLASKINPSFLTERSFIEGAKDRIYVISGGFKECIIPTAIMLGIKTEHIFANSFIYDAEGKVLGVDTTCALSQTLGKVKQAKLLNLPRPIHIIGDGYTDFELFKEGAADAFYCFTESVSRANVIKHAAVCVDSLTAYRKLTQQ